MPENTYEVRMVPIGKIKPDPSQPRKRFSAEDIDGLVRSVRETGLIKNIEVDKNGVIVTGELRWRAAKQAGLKEVPVRLVDVTKEERKVRQLHENVHHYAMTPIETAEAIVAAFPDAHAGTGMDSGNNHTRIGKKIGKSPLWVRDHLALLKMPLVIKTAIDRRELPMDTIRSLQTVARMEKEGEVKRGTSEAFKKKIERGDIRKKETVRAVTQAIADNPGAAADYLKVSYKDKDYHAVHAAIEDIAPTFVGQEANHTVTLEGLKTHARRVTKLLSVRPYEEYGGGRGPVLNDLRNLREALGTWHESLK